MKAEYGGRTLVGWWERGFNQPGARPRSSSQGSTPGGRAHSRMQGVSLAAAAAAAATRVAGDPPITEPRAWRHTPYPETQPAGCVRAERRRI
jgi:hypothetical protein